MELEHEADAVPSELVEARRGEPRDVVPLEPDRPGRGQVQGAEHVEQGPAPALDKAALNDEQKDLRRLVHQTIAKIGDDFARRFTFNTAIAAVMELLNAVSKFKDDPEQGRAVRHEALETAVVTLAPIVPHITHSLWQALGHDEAVVDAPWPQVDESALVAETVELVVQVNGKLRGRINVPADADKAAAEKAALADPNVQRFTEGKAVKRVIVVPGKLVNIVVA